MWLNSFLAMESCNSVEVISWGGPVNKAGAVNGFDLLSCFGLSEVMSLNLANFFCVDGVTRVVGMIRLLCFRSCLMRILLCLGFALLACVGMAEEKPGVVVNVGDKAPMFEAMDDQGKVWKSAEHIGRKVLVVYFYPADLTGGCTKQACAFRDDHEALTKAGIEVVGVSGDTPENHQLFRKVHSLNFTLLADEDGKLARAFGVPLRDGDTITRQVDGVDKVLTRGVTASRWTFVIGLDGKVIHKNTVVDAAADSKNVLEAVKQHTAGVKS